MDLGTGGAPAFLPLLVGLLLCASLFGSLDAGGWAVRGLLTVSAFAVVAFLTWAYRARGRTFPPGRLGWFLRRARGHARRGRFARALKCCDRATDLAPRSARVHEERALVYLRMGQYEKGVEEFEAGRASDPDRFEMYGLFAATYARLGDFARAEAGYREVLARRPRDWTAWHGLGFALWRQGKREEAVAALRDGIERCEWSDVLVPPAMTFLARLGKTPEAEELGRARRPRMRRRFWWRAAAGHLVGDLSEAVLRRWTAWTREPTWRVAIYFYLAERAAARGDAERAKAYRDRCVREGKAHESRGLACLVPEWGLALADSVGS
ncbi:MAG: tetratricopeptide repeat protein [Planctomycetes bacterium]|nr:tetratricopeptide repeat protein [Planctomycetota bacterium]